MVSLDPSRPLIICDADEVLLQFMAGLESYARTLGFYHDFSSFRIHGNIRHQANDEPLDDAAVTSLISQFFATCTRDLEPVPHASNSLASLSRHAQIIILSNLPATAREDRIDNLTRHGMPYPVIAGSGPKGSIVSGLIAGFGQPVVFIDDLPPHHTSVAQLAPHVHRLHFVADQRLARLVPPSPDAHRRIDTWPEAEHWISGLIKPP